MVFTHGVLCAGGTIVFPQAGDRDGLLLAINRCAVSHLIISPASMLPIVSVLPQQGMLLPTLKHLRLVGATPAAALLAKLRQHCTPNVCVPYGLTELGPISMADGEILLRHPDSAGRVYPWARVEIVDARGQPVAAGVSGEIRVAVDAMPVGYHRPDDDADGKFRDGWFYPGDRARVSAEGLLFVEGRIDHILNIGGYKISPEKVEATLAEYPLVIEAAVHIDVAADGESRLLAAIVQAPGASLDGLAEFGRQRLGVMAPHTYRVVDKLPRNAMGKLQRDRLADLKASEVAAAWQ
jgi:acyl-coenzyme A synthetase/AMP-(fatty) acid ligase